MWPALAQASCPPCGPDFCLGDARYPALLARKKQDLANCTAYHFRSGHFTSQTPPTGIISSLRLAAMLPLREHKGQGTGQESGEPWAPCLCPTLCRHKDQRYRQQKQNVYTHPVEMDSTPSPESLSSERYPPGSHSPGSRSSKSAASTRDFSVLRQLVA